MAVKKKKRTMAVVSRKVKSIRKNQKETLELKNTVTVLKNASCGFISIFNMAEERMSELNNKSIETFQANAEEKRIKQKTKPPITVAQLQKV